MLSISLIKTEYFPYSHNSLLAQTINKMKKKRNKIEIECALNKYSKNHVIIFLQTIYVTLFQRSPRERPRFLETVFPTESGVYRRHSN